MSSSSSLLLSSLRSIAAAARCSSTSTTTRCRCYYPLKARMMNSIMSTTVSSSSSSSSGSIRNYRALQLSLEDDGIKGAKSTLIDTPPTMGDIEGYDTVVQVDYSSINYKDALAVNGVKSVMRINPLIPGIDLAGTVVKTTTTSSTNAVLKVGDKVILTGYGGGETHNGGLQTEARVKAEQLVALPSNMDTFTAMSVGTAGYTAMMCMLALEKAGVTPDKGGPVVVTGACGGVGSIGILMLSRAGYEVCAITGRPEEERAFLEGLGASKIIHREEYSKDPRPLGKEKWAGGLDTVGSKILANVLSEVKYGGSVAACGLAAGMDLNTTVAPFILRGVSLLGIDSVQSSKEMRNEAWSRLAEGLEGVDMEALGIVRKVGLEDVVETSKTILNGKIRGRTVVDLTKDA